VAGTPEDSAGLVATEVGPAAASGVAEQLELPALHLCLEDTKLRTLRDIEQGVHRGVRGGFFGRGSVLEIGERRQPLLDGGDVRPGGWRVLDEVIELTEERDAILHAATAHFLEGFEPLAERFAGLGIEIEQLARLHHDVAIEEADDLARGEPRSIPIATVLLAFLGPIRPVRLGRYGYGSQNEQQGEHGKREPARVSPRPATPLATRQAHREDWLSSASISCAST